MKKNYIYNVIYQILILIIPLVTVPYVSRVLGASGIGIYSYTYSIVHYFMILAMLGLNNYGNRSIAQIRDDKEKLSQTFKEIYGMQLLVAFMMVIFYIIYLCVFDIDYKNIAIIQTLYIISCVFDINWFFFGIEKFKLTVTRNTIIKILSLVFIFVFVKDKNDVWIYTLILSGSVLLSQLMLFPFLKQYLIKDQKVEFKNIIKHLVPCLKLFLPVIAVTIYRVMDKTMIGLFSTMEEVGFYENAEKIVGVPSAIISALGTVMLPRMSNVYAKNNDDIGLKIINKSIKFIMFLTFAMTLGLIVISTDFSVVFFGSEFEKVGLLISVLSFTLVFVSFGNVIRTQYLIPKEMDKQYITSAFLGAGVNFVLNIILINKFQSVGACIGTVAAEFVVTFYQVYSVRRKLPIKKYLIEILPFILKAFGMMIIILPLGNLSNNRILIIILQIVFGIIIYGILNFNYVIKLLNITRKK